MEKLNASLPALITLAILAATMWYPYHRVLKYSANETEREEWRKQHPLLFTTTFLMYAIGCVTAWHTIVFYTPLILLFDDFTKPAWIAVCGCGVLFYFVRGKSIIHLDWNSGENKTSELTTLKWIRVSRKLVNNKTIRTTCGLLYSIGMAALAIKLQSVWMIYIAQILFVPAFILLLFIIPIIFLLGVWIYFTIGEKYDDYKVRRRYSH